MAMEAEMVIGSEGALKAVGADWVEVALGADGLRGLLNICC